MVAQLANVCSASGFDASEIVSDAEVLDLLARLPQGHVNSPALRSIEYVDELREEDEGSRHRRFPRNQIFGEWYFNAETGEGRAVVFRQHSDGNLDGFNFLQSILHEIGHAVYHRLSPEDKAEWAQLHASSVVLMYEQGRAANEHFCHLYSAYYLRHGLVRARFGHFYSFLKNRVFDGKEY